MKTNKKLNPVGEDERIHVLDALRGFAIFGIFIINIRVFSGYSFMQPGERNGLWLSDWNSIFDWLHIVLFSGKFYTLFSLLFGIGFAIQFIRASSSDRSFLRHFSRRLFFLLLIGVVHLWGIWFSDILVIYALCGYILLLFKGFSNRSLLWIVFLMLLLPGLHSMYLTNAEAPYTQELYHFLSQSWNESDLPKNSEEQITFVMNDVVEVIKIDSWQTVFSFNYIGPLLRGYMVAMDLRVVKVLAIFILGLWTGRQLLNHKLHENRPFLRHLVISGFLIGITLNIMGLLNNFTGLSNQTYSLIQEFVSPFAYVSLTAGYVACFMLLYQASAKSVMTRWFNAVGKTALTNYILQSVIGIVLFYEAGLGLWKYFGSAGLTLAVLLICIVQVLISRLWLKHFRYGPLEWVWRVLTYGRFIQNKRNK